MHQLSLRKLAGFAFVASATVCTMLPVARAEVFQVTIENLSPNVLTPPVFITHDAGFDLFDGGAVASGNLERLAEDGIFANIVAQANWAGAAVLDVQVAGGAPIGPLGSATVTIQADLAHPWFSHASMLAFSNDAFIGAAFGDGAINLFPGGLPFAGQLLIQPGDVWDAGTEVNDELAVNVPGLGAGVEAGVPEGGVIVRGHPGILGVGGISSDKDWRAGPVAQITFIPEPSTLTMLAAIGSLGVLVGIRRRRHEDAE